MVKLPMYPAHPERVCWGCDRYCPAHDLACGNGSERTQHPQELFGNDWVEWAAERLGDSIELIETDVSTSDALARGSLTLSDFDEEATGTAGTTRFASVALTRALPERRQDHWWAS